MSEDNLSQEEIDGMLEKLAKHYHEPVLPVSEYCKAFYTWFDKIKDKYDEGGQDILYGLRTRILKSNLLYRMIYCGQPLRTEPCPTHKGKWSGIGICPHGCGETGWLKTPELAAKQIEWYRKIFKKTDEEAVEFVKNYVPSEKKDWKLHNEYQCHCEWVMLIGRGEVVPESVKNPRYGV